MQEGQSQFATRPRKWSLISINNPMKNKTVVEGFQKTTVITNSHFEVSANLH